MILPGREKKNTVAFFQRQILNVSMGMLRNRKQQRLCMSVRMLMAL